MNNPTSSRLGRRQLLAAVAATAGAAALPQARAQQMDFKPNVRYPDASVQILDPSFAKYRLFSSSVEQLASGMRWAEGPVWFGDGRYLLVSDIPNNRIMRYDEASGAWGLFRSPSNFANGNTRDRQGRLVTCEHLGRRVTRTEYDGHVTVLADGCNGKKLNSPNDIVCQSNGAIWFTDPPRGIAAWEGDKAAPELPHGVYRIDPAGKLQQMVDDLVGPTPVLRPTKLLYIVSARSAQPQGVADVGADGKLANKPHTTPALARWTACAATKK
jgi:gluconolactonase